MNLQKSKIFPQIKCSVSEVD